MGQKPLLAFTLVLFGGLLFGEAFSLFPLTLVFFIFVFLVLEACFFRSRLLPLRFLVFWAIGFLLHQATATPHSTHDLSRYLDQGRIRLVAEVIAPPRHTEKYVVLRMKGLEIISERSNALTDFKKIDGLFQLYIAKPEVPFEYGDRLEMSIRLRKPNQYQNPGAFLYADYQRRIGWNGSAWLSDWHQIKKLSGGGNPILKTIYRWRETLRQRISSEIDPPAAAMLMAVLIGESGYLDDETREVFADAGIAHLLAVSGTHLAFVALIIFFLSRQIFLLLPEAIFLRCTTYKIPSQWAALITAFPVTFYAFLTGGKISTMRALTMILVYLFSIWIGRSRDAMTSLSLAALLILLFRPQAIFEISFQLSFLAVISIVLFIDWQKEDRLTALSDMASTPLPSSFQKYVMRPLRLLLLSSFAAMIGTAPLTLYLFHQFSWVGLLANLFLLPIAGWILIPFALCSAIFSLFFSDGFLLAPWHEWLWDHFFDLIQFFAHLPGAGFHFSSPPLLMIFLFYGFLFTALMTQKSKKHLGTIIASFFVFFLGIGALRFPPEKTRVTFIDVAQGDASLIEFPNGETLLIDGGSERAGKFAIAPYLWQRGIHKIDTLIVTHPQSDHIGGLSFILRKFKVENIWTNGLENETEIYQSFKKYSAQAGSKQHVITRAHAGLTIDECWFLFLHPHKSSGQNAKNINNDSIVFKMTCALDDGTPLSFLFTGDIEKEAEAELMKNRDQLKSEILKVPHHGSRSSSGDAFIAAISPKLAIFSVGRKNPYRHPHKKVISAYEGLGTEIFRTDQVGAVFVEVGNEAVVSTFFDKKQMRIQWDKPLGRQEWQNIKKVFLW